LAYSIASLNPIVNDASDPTNPFYDRGQNQHGYHPPQAIEGKIRSLLDLT